MPYLYEKSIEEQPQSKNRRQSVNNAVVNNSVILGEHYKSKSPSQN